MIKTTLEEVHDNLQKRSKDFTDKTIVTNSIKFENLETVKIGDTYHGIRPIAQNKIAAKLGVPANYLRKCEPEIQAYNLNHWMQKKAVKTKNVFVRFDKNDIRAIFTTKYRPLDNLEVVNHLLKYSYKPDVLVNCLFGEDFMSLNILSRENSFKIAKGDELIPGVTVSNSEIGRSSLGVAMFLFRLICSNGMVARVGFGKYSTYRHISAKNISKFLQSVKSIPVDKDIYKERLQIAMDKSVANPEKLLLRYNKKYKVREETAPAVQWGWEQEKGNNLYNIINAYTRASQYDGLTAKTRYLLQTIGGNILEKIS